jgi:hypothetical protein
MEAISSPTSTSDEDARPSMEIEAFLLKRGYCCDSGCKHCPYKKEKKVKKRLWEKDE